MSAAARLPNPPLEDSVESLRRPTRPPRPSGLFSCLVAVIALTVADGRHELGHAPIPKLRHTISRAVKVGHTAITGSARFT
jgi:hypothetical protein